MATVIRKEEHEFRPNPGKIDGFRLFTDISREEKGCKPGYLNFDMRLLNPHQYNAPYHFHRYAEELFFITSGTATLRTPAGLEIVNEGDILFFEAGDSGAHQLYNHSERPCTYLDMRSYIGHDVCEYPDSDKVILVPGGETFSRSGQHSYFEGETGIERVWEQLRQQQD